MADEKRKTGKRDSDMGTMVEVDRAKDRRGETNSIRNADKGCVWHHPRELGRIMGEQRGLLEDIQVDVSQ